MEAPRACVVGWPIEHSRSPVIHRYWLKKHGLPGSYRREAVPPEAFPDFVRGLAGHGYVGANITIPHKEDAARLADRLTPVAEQLGAANTLWLEGGRVHGNNTDAYGFTANLDERAPGWADGGEAVVIGAGGAARAVVFALLERGFDKVRILNRTESRATALVGRFGSRTVAGPLNDLAAVLPRADLVVNTTAAGLAGSGGLAVDWALARDAAIATDIVYAPLVTPFLQGAAARGLTVVDGLGMLLHQAVLGFERWFGRRPVVDDDLRRAVLADLGA